MAIDPNAMYRAGLARGTTGRNPQVERRVARQENLMNLAYTVVGSVANEAIKDGFENIQKFRDLKESQTATMNLTAEKIPQNNTTLSASITTLNNEVRAFDKQIRLTLSPKKRAQLRALRQAKFKEMTNLNAELTAFQSHVPNSQGKMNVAAGLVDGNNEAGNVTYSPAAGGEAIKNVGEQATLELGENLFYDHDGCQCLRVYRGGKWVDKGDGTREYVSLDPSENEDLIKKHKKYEKDFKSQQLDSSLNLPEEEKAKALSYDEWVKTQNQKTMRTPKYSELKFARKEDRTMTNDDRAVSNDFRKLGYTSNTLDFEGMKVETYNKIDDYTNSAFEDYFFGGPGYNYSTRTSSTESLAYKMLLSRNADTNFTKGPGEDDGFARNNFIPPGTKGLSTPESDKIWQGAMTTLKAQDMSAGTDYRKFAQEKMWGKYKGVLDAAQLRWKTDNPGNDGDPDWKKLGFSNIDQYHNSDYYKINVLKQNPEEITDKAENRSIEFDFYSGATSDSGDPISVKRNTTSHALINLDNQLGDLVKPESSFDTESYVDVYGQRIGYFPGKGFAKVRLATKDDVKNKKFENALERPIKVGEIIRIDPGSDVAYWKSPKEVFRHFSIPMDYSKKRFYEGQEETHKSGRPIIFKGGKWVYND